MSSFARDLPIVAQLARSALSIASPGGTPKQYLWASTIPRKADSKVHLPLTAEASAATARRWTGAKIFPLRRGCSRGLLLSLTKRLKSYQEIIRRVIRKSNGCIYIHIYRQINVYIYIQLQAFDLILRKGSPGEAYNIGAEASSTRSVLEVATALMRHFGIEKDAAKHLQAVADRLKNDSSYDVESSKLLALGWQPSVTFEEL